MSKRLLTLSTRLLPVIPIALLIAAVLSFRLHNENNPSEPLRPKVFSSVESNWLFISFGESNSGGYASNDDLSGTEAASRPSLQIWNVITNDWEPLDIGTNNNLGHYRLTSSTHGWENGLSTLVDADPLLNAFYLQTGQGGSRVADWDGIGSDPFIQKRNSRVRRVTGAMDFDHVVWWVSLGINDAIDGTNATTYETKMRDVLNDLHALCPGSHIVIAELPDDHSGSDQMRLQQQYNAVIRNIAATRLDVTNVSVDNLSMRDTNHWDYQGMEQLAKRMYDVSLVFQKPVRQQTGDQ